MRARIDSPRMALLIAVVVSACGPVWAETDSFVAWHLTTDTPVVNLNSAERRSTGIRQ